MTLEQLLIYVIDGFAGVAIYAGLEKWRWFQNIKEPDYKRWFAIAVSAGFAVLAWGVGVGLGIFALPVGTWQDVVVQIANIVLGAVTTFGTSQTAHTRALKAARVK